MMKNLLRLAYFMICISAMFSTNTHAYLDPSSATYVLQIVAGLFVVGGMAFGIFWHRIKRLFKRNDSTSEKQKGKDEDVQDEHLAD